MPLQLHRFSPGGYAANSYLLIKEGSALLIDATAPPAELSRVLERSSAQLLAILLTHGHFDHLLTAEPLLFTHRVPLYLHKDDAELTGDGEKNASAPFLGESLTFPPASKLLAGGEVLTLGALRLGVYHTPGHTAGSVTYLVEGHAFTGDTLFDEGVGRTDLYGGDPAALRASLERLSALLEGTRIYPGHGADAPLSHALSHIF